MDRNALMNQLVVDEGVKLKPYKDTVGKTTIGVGRNLDDVGLSYQEVMGLLSNDIARVCKELDTRFPWWAQLSDKRQQVLANMAFNLGTDKLAAFRNMMAAVQMGHYDEAAAEMMNSKWASQVGDRAKRLANMMRTG